MNCGHVTFLFMIVGDLTFQFEIMEAFLYYIYPTQLCLKILGGKFQGGVSIDISHIGCTGNKVKPLALYLVIAVDKAAI